MLITQIYVLGRNLTQDAFMLVMSMCHCTLRSDILTNYSLPDIVFGLDDCDLKLVLIYIDVFLFILKLYRTVVSSHN